MMLGFHAAAFIPFPTSGWLARNACVSSLSCDVSNVVILSLMHLDLLLESMLNMYSLLQADVRFLRSLVPGEAFIGIH